MDSRTDTLSESPSARRELTLVGVVAALFLLVPLATGELYPFSSATMFARRPEVTCHYSVFDHDGNELSPRPFGLRRNNPHDPPAITLGRNGYGRTQSESINRSGFIASEEIVRASVESELRRRPHLPYVVIRQTIHGADDTGSVGHLKTQVWQIKNPSGNPASSAGSTASPCWAAARQPEARQ